MNIGVNGGLNDEKILDACVIGCGAHAFRNIYPALQFVPVRLKAVCARTQQKAGAFAAKFGAGAAYDNYREMLRIEKPDVVFVVLDFDGNGRPKYPKVAVDCMDAGAHVWIEKPPASSCDEVAAMMEASARNQKITAVGFKKVFAPANAKAKELSEAEEFGRVTMTQLQYPCRLPDHRSLVEYIVEKKGNDTTWLLDSVVHPLSLLIHLRGMPDRFFYERGACGAGLVTFAYGNGEIAGLALSKGAANDGGIERTVIVSDKGRHIVVDNTVRLSYHKNPPLEGGGMETDYYRGLPGQVTSIWEPEFSMGQLHNKTLFLQGFYHEIDEFVRAVKENRGVTKGSLEQAMRVTAIFEKFAEGPGKVIRLP